MAVELTDGDILQYTLNCRYQGQVILNTWNFRVTQFVPDLVDYEDFCMEVLTDLRAPGTLIDDLEALTVPEYSFVDHRLQRVYPSRNRAVIDTLTTIGTLGETGCTVNQAAVVTKQGNVAGRFAIGSWHQTGLAQNAFEATGNIALATRTALAAALSPLASVINPDGFAGTTLSPILWGRAVPLRQTPIAQLTAQISARVMRRRTVGLGI